MILDEVGVRYRRPRENVSGLKEFAIRWLQRRITYEDFWALQGVSFRLEPGEVFGVIGRNGSGKSTLLKVMARVLTPTRGRVRLYGQVAPLLELGGGFHPELTGRENVFLNSALLGRPRRLTARLLDSIVDFAELAEFIDAPLRTYSSGMVARLGFAVATCQRPDILLVDEVLSVGDSQFQDKCLERILSFQQQGTTIVMVSHSMMTIETYCRRALWLERGKARACGPVEGVIAAYADSLTGETGTAPVEPAATGAAAPSDPRLIAARLLKGAPLAESGKLYPAAGLLDVRQGSLALWARLRPDRHPGDAVLFHSDDSRYVLYLGSYEHHGELRRVLAARAGGNRRALDTFYGTTHFPEASVLVDADGRLSGADFPAGVWRPVIMTWRGYPEGSVRLYVGGKLLSERSYSPRNDDGRPLPAWLALGYRPAEWSGEFVEGQDGALVDQRPASTLSVAQSDIEICGARLYPHALSPEEAAAHAAQGAP